MKDKIKAAYDKAMPDTATQHRILRNVLNAQQPRRRQLLPRLAFVTVLVVVCAVGYTGLRRLPWDGTPSNTQTAPTMAQSTANQPGNDDDYYHEQAYHIYTMLSSPIASDLETNYMYNPTLLQITHTTDNYYGYDEVNLTYESDDVCFAAVFYAESGVLQRLRNNSPALWLAKAMNTDGIHFETAYERALLVAQTVYQALPIPQGYAYTGMEQWEDNAWLFYFKRQIGDYTSDCEQVIIKIDPKLALFIDMTVLYYPLDDAHAHAIANNAPTITQDQAEAIVRAQPHLNHTDYTLINAELAIAMPNNFLNDQPIIMDNSKLSWILLFNRPNTLGSIDNAVIMVDAYNGDLLGGDRTL